MTDLSVNFRHFRKRWPANCISSESTMLHPPTSRDVPCSIPPSGFVSNPSPRPHHPTVECEPGCRLSWRSPKPQGGSIPPAALFQLAPPHPCDLFPSCLKNGHGNGYFAFGIFKGEERHQKWVGKGRPGNFCTENRYFFA